MGENKSLPIGVDEALALLYLRKLDTSRLTPGQFSDKYEELLAAIQAHRHPPKTGGSKMRIG